MLTHRWVLGYIPKFYNPGHNILELYSILVQIRFPTSKTKLDIQYSKLGIRVTSRVAKQLKTQDLRKLGNIRKISNLGGHIVQCLVSLQELRLCEQQLKNTQKQIPNFSFPVQFYWITPCCSKYLFHLYHPPYISISSLPNSLYQYFISTILPLLVFHLYHPPYISISSLPSSLYQYFISAIFPILVFHFYHPPYISISSLPSSLYQCFTSTILPILVFHLYHPPYISISSLPSSLYQYFISTILPILVFHLHHPLFSSASDMYRQQHWSKKLSSNPTTTPLPQATPPQ